MIALVVASIVRVLPRFHIGMEAIPVIREEIARSLEMAEDLTEEQKTAVRYLCIHLENRLTDFLSSSPS